MKRAALLTVVLVAGSLGCNGAGGPAGATTARSASTSASSASGSGAGSGSTGTGTGAGSGTAAPNTGSVAGIPAIFPPDNPWNTDISSYPVHANSANFISSIGAATGLHPDFGSDPNGGIPFVVVDGTQPLVPITLGGGASESDPGPYPVPANAPIEGGVNGTGDRHVLVVDNGNKKLYEMFSSFPDAMTGGWDCSSGAVFDLTSNNLRPLYWTSADAAGLPIFPGLVRFDEVASGAINHALRFTVVTTQHGFVSPARHWASSNTSANVPPMGLRLRLKATTNVAGLPPEVQVICKCLMKYGMLLADNGSNWFISGAPDPRWNDSNLHLINQVVGGDFEVVDTGPITTQ